jgi:hypothetical protein
LLNSCKPINPISAGRAMERQSIPTILGTDNVLETSSEASYFHEHIAPAYVEELEFDHEIGRDRNGLHNIEKTLIDLQNDAYDEKDGWFDLDSTEAFPAAITDDEVLTEALKFAQRRPVFPGGFIPRLEKPVVVPQVRNGVGMPFVRAFSEALEPFDINQVEWLAFVDSLNVVATANPPLQVLDLVGNIVGFM